MPLLACVNEDVAPYLLVREHAIDGATIGYMYPGDCTQLWGIQAYPHSWQPAGLWEHCQNCDLWGLKFETNPGAFAILHGGRCYVTLYAPETANYTGDVRACTEFVPDVNTLVVP
jgi:hypothetical protein